MSVCLASQSVKRLGMIHFSVPFYTHHNHLQRQPAPDESAGASVAAVADAGLVEGDVRQRQLVRAGYRSWRRRRGRPRQATGRLSKTL